MINRMLGAVVVGVLAVSVVHADVGESYSAGSVSGQNNWAGSGLYTNDSNQQDFFPLYAGQTYDQTNAGQSVVVDNGGYSSYDDANETNPLYTLTSGVAHSGTQAWHLKRGYDTSGTGGPQSPVLTTGASNGSAVADVFYAQFSIRAAQAGDLSKVRVIPGKADGSDRTANTFDIENTAAGLKVTTYEHPTGQNWDAHLVDLGTFTGDSNGWMTFSMQGTFLADGSTVWSYFHNGSIMTGVNVDGVATSSFGGYYSDVRADYGWDSEDADRLRFEPKHANYEQAYQGFLIDDMLYQSLHSSDLGTAVSQYATSFEAVDTSVAKLPEPATMSLLALGGLAVLKRRRKNA